MLVIYQVEMRRREHLMIAAGYVQKKSSPYSSTSRLKEWLTQKKGNREYLKAMELEDQDAGECISLINKVAGSAANPANITANSRRECADLKNWRSWNLWLVISIR